MCNALCISMGLFVRNNRGGEKFGVVSAFVSSEVAVLNCDCVGVL